MALIDKDTVRFLGGGVVGAGAVVLFPFIGPVFIALARPLLKSLIRQSVIGLEQGRERLATATETLEDLFAEVRSEIEEERQAAVAKADNEKQSAGAAPGASNTNGAEESA